MIWLHSHQGVGHGRFNNRTSYPMEQGQADRPETAAVIKKPDSIGLLVAIWCQETNPMTRAREPLAGSQKVLPRSCATP